MEVDAVVVTYNRKELLAEAVEAVLDQTRPVRRVYVVDNASTDGTPELLRGRGLLDRPDVELVVLPDNRGGAGGFSRGVEIAREGPATWLWLMDDDAEPAPDALERLLAAPEAADLRTVALAPKVVYAATGALDDNQRGHFRRRLRSLPESEYRPGHHPEIGYTSFVGSLVRAATARELDPPRADFFVWGDDVEYSLRLARHGAIRLVPESVMRHKRATHSYETRRSRALNRLLPVAFHPSRIEAFWMHLCGLRNLMWMKREYEGQGPLSAAGTTLQFLVKHAVWDDRPLTRLPWVLRFARDGRRGRFRNIPPAQWRARVGADRAIG
jgi:rhamnopyranosyl-N-acetylglucosaminyl-diphospho-decaprenol beta-1,3/1,4-galactofuranosyltransferase